MRNEILLAHSPDGRILYLTLQFSSSDLDGGSFVSTLSRAFLSTPAYLLFVSQVASSSEFRQRNSVVPCLKENKNGKLDAIIFPVRRLIERLLRQDEAPGHELSLHRRRVCGAPPHLTDDQRQQDARAETHFPLLALHSISTFRFRLTPNGDVRFFRTRYLYSVSASFLHCTWRGFLPPVMIRDRERQWQKKKAASVSSNNNDLALRFVTLPRLHYLLAARHLRPH